MALLHQNKSKFLFIQLRNRGSKVLTTLFLCQIKSSPQKHDHRAGEKIFNVAMIGIVSWELIQSLTSFSQDFLWASYCAVSPRSTIVSGTLMVPVIMKCIVWQETQWIGWSLQELLTLSPLENPSQIFFVEWQGAKNGAKWKLNVLKRKLYCTSLRTRFERIDCSRNK